MPTYDEDDETETEATVRVRLVDDDALVRAGLAALLDAYAPRVVLVEGDGPATVTLVDPFGPTGAGLNSLHELTTRLSGDCVVVFTYRRDPRLVDAALAAGAKGFLTKGTPAEELVRELERVAAGEVVVSEAPADDGGGTMTARRWSLTDREADVATLLAQGLRNSDIASALRISPNTVKTHLRALFRKLGVVTRAQAVALVLGPDGAATAKATAGGADATAQAPNGFYGAGAAAETRPAETGPDGTEAAAMESAGTEATVEDDASPSYAGQEAPAPARQ